MCSPSLRICEKNEYNTAIFQLLEDALNDPAHPLHEKAVEHNPFIEIKDESLTPLKAEPVQLSGQSVKAEFCALQTVPIKTEPFNLKTSSQLPL